MTDCVVITPMLGRAWHIPRLAASLHSSTTGARLLIVASLTDPEVHATAVACGVDVITVHQRNRGDYAAKIHAGIAASTEPWIFTGACDLHFHPGWLDECRHMMDTTGALVAGTNDLTGPRTATGGHSTHSLVHRDYLAQGLIDGRPGLLCEDYLHEYVDDELVGTAQARGEYVHCPRSVVEHLHPIAGKAEWDITYLRMRDRMRSDRALLLERSAMWARQPAT
jgi:hypothetical protein